MQLEYDVSIEKFFKDDDYQALIKKIGYDMARTVKKRIKALKASNSFKIYCDTGMGNPHPLKGNNEGCYGISITANYRLVVRPNTVDGRDIVLIKGVVDYHGTKEDWIIP